MADNVIVTELMEKVSSLYSAALAVPIACDALPSAIPLPMGLCTRASLSMDGAMIAPDSPANITLIIVVDGLLPKLLAISIATGVVMDFGIMERMKPSSI